MVDEVEVNKVVSVVKVIKDECEVVLVVVMLVLEEVFVVLDMFFVNDINYVKKLVNFFYFIKLVLEVVCVILEVKFVKVFDGKGG